MLANGTRPHCACSKAVHALSGAAQDTRSGVLRPSQRTSSAEEATLRGPISDSLPTLKLHRALLCWHGGCASDQPPLVSEVTAAGPPINCSQFSTRCKWRLVAPKPMQSKKWFRKWHWPMLSNQTHLPVWWSHPSCPSPHSLGKKTHLACRG